MSTFNNTPSRDREVVKGTTLQAIRIQSIVLLAGAVSPSGLAARLGRSVFELPLSPSERLRDAWMARVRQFCASRVPDELIPPDVLVLATEAEPIPTISGSTGGVRLRVARDRSLYRGTAGALRDLSAGLPDDDYLLVGNASQCPDDGLIAYLVDSALPNDGITLCAGLDGTPSGLMLVRCEALKDIAAVGYVDLKEQALSRIARSFGVRVVTHPNGATPPIRDLRRYVDAVRSWHATGSLRGVRTVRPFAEHWRAAFSIVERDAQVSPLARLHDSIVLAGGRVDSHAQVVRSVVGPGGVVPRGRQVIDELVVGDRARQDTMDAPERQP